MLFQLLKKATQGPSSFLGFWSATLGVLIFHPQTYYVVVTRWFLLFPELFSQTGGQSRKEAIGENAFLPSVALFVIVFTLE